MLLQFDNICQKSCKIAKLKSSLLATIFQVKYTQNLNTNLNTILLNFGMIPSQILKKVKNTLNFCIFEH